MDSGGALVTLLPVISRELLVQARQPATYWMRVLTMLAVLVTALLIVADLPDSPNLGRQLFTGLHTVLFFSVLLLVTFSAVDCLSRERREGTLGLLFLTELTPGAVVAAKGFAQGARALTVLLAALPVFAMPILLGGVSWQQVAITTLLVFSAGALALGAALIASARSKRFTVALVWSAVIMIGALLLWNGMLGFIVSRTGGMGRRYGYGLGFEYYCALGSSISSGLMFYRWQFFGGMGTPTIMLWAVAKAAALAAGWLVFAAVFAGWKIRRVWREEPPSAQRVWLQEKFTKPVVGLGFFRRWMRRSLERNPIGWLERRTWQGRTVTWAWFAVVISVMSSALSYQNMARGFSDFAEFLSWLMVLSMAATVSASFRRERETGVMELLLVAPLNVEQIILGRLKGVWLQFLPAAGMLVFVWVYLANILRHDDVLPTVAKFAMIFASLPVIGLYFSVRCRNFVTALLLTVAVAVVLPLFEGMLLEHLLQEPGYGGGQYSSPPGALMFIQFFIQFMVAGVFFAALHGRLRNRTFPLERSLP